MTAGSWIDHEKLQIVKGVGKTPTDTNSAENDPVVVNLLSGPITLETNGWSPQIAATKSGGVWADSPITDGRTLLAAPEGNVTEKMTLIIADRSYLSVVRALSSLNYMAKDCRDFWQTVYQIDPVYLVWKARCGAGEQYALLYNIEIAPEYKDGPDPIINASITLEREPFWRGIPPGANPKLWSFYVNGKQLGINATIIPSAGNANLDLNNTNGALVSNLTLLNKFEWTPAAAGAQTTPLSQNYIDIPASLIPGDVPALIHISAVANQMADLYIGLTSKKQSAINHLGVTKYNALNLNVGDADVAGTMTKASPAGTDGMLSNNSAVTYYYGTRTKTGVDSSFVQVAQWGSSPTSANGITLDRELFRGSYAVFVRAANVSGTPVIGDIDMQLIIDEVEGGSGTSQMVDSFTSPVVAVPVAVSSGGVQYPPLSYMGTVTIPFATRAVNSLKGYGLQIQEGSSVNSLRVTLYNRVNTATASRIIRVYDVMFMPLDEGMAQIILPFGAGSGDNILELDNTGYLAHGQPGQYCLGYNLSQISGGISMEVRGQDLLLYPKRDYRIYALKDTWITSSTKGSEIQSGGGFSSTLIVNIVPRWAGIRDS